MRMRLAILIFLAALTGCGAKDTKKPSAEGSGKIASLNGCSSNAAGNLVVCGASKEFIDRELTPYFGELKPINNRESKDDDELPAYANRLNANGDIPFVEHDFGAECFNTWGCTVEYAGRRQLDMSPDILSAPFSSMTKLNQASQARVKNFPPAAKVEWRSRDGEHHLAYIDLDKIFWERRFLHHMYVKDIREDEAMPSPGIAILVDDRRVAVYMIARIKLKRVVEHDGERSANPYDPQWIEGVMAYEKYF